MSDMMENKMSESELQQVGGGNAYDYDKYNVRPIKKTRVKVTASELNCRYYPNGPVAKTYEYGHVLWVDGITNDGLWYKLLIYNPKGGVCDGYIFKQYTQVF